MKKLWILLFCLIPFICHATMMTDFTEDTTPSSTDIVWTTKNPGTTPLDRKVSLANLFGIGLGLNNTWTGSNTFTGAVDLQSTFTFGSSTGVVYNTGGTVSTETSLSSTVLGGFTPSTPLASDGSGNATTLSSQNVITTGYIDGLINMTVSSSTPVTVSGSTGYYINGQDGVITFNLPAAAAKKAYCFANALYARAITIHPASGDYIILAGENNDSSDVVSAGASTDKICVLAIDSTYWLVTSSTGTWGND